MFVILLRNKEKYLRSIKIAFATVVSILIAMLFSLKSPYTAGIITILSIQNTKVETLQKAFGRAIAFAVALVIAWICFSLCGYHVYSFAIYLFFYAAVCLMLGYADAIAMNSVLITHFLAEKSMNMQLLWNEIGLFVIGVSLGVLVNIFMHKKSDTFSKLAEAVDKEMIGIISRMAVRLNEADKSDYNRDCFTRLDEKLLCAKEYAIKNDLNSIIIKNRYEIDYIEMRTNQRYILEHIYDSIKMITSLPKQTKVVSAYLDTIAKEYHQFNDVKKLRALGEQYMLSMKSEILPQSREEFEARAILYHILKELDSFLQQKSEFAKKYESNINV